MAANEARKKIEPSVQLSQSKSAQEEWKGAMSVWVISHEAARGYMPDDLA